MRKINMLFLALTLVLAPLAACVVTSDGSSKQNSDKTKSQTKDTDSDDAGTDKPKEQKEPEKVKCTNDWQCAVGKVCRVMAGESSKICQAAEAEETRFFGQVILNPEESGNWVVAVYSVPTGAEEAKLGSDAYTLAVDIDDTDTDDGDDDDTDDDIIDDDGDDDDDDDGDDDDDIIDDDDGGSAFAARKSSAFSRLSPEWQARLAFENARDKRIKRLVKDIRSGKKSWVLKKDGGRGSCVPTSCNGVCVKGSCVALEETASFNIWMNDTKATLDAVLCSNDDGVAVFVDSADIGAEDVSAKCSEVASMVDPFATIIMPRDLRFFGSSAKHEGPLDRDGNGVMMVVLSSKLCKLNVLGYFDDRDYLDSSMTDSGASGNEADILWIRSIDAVGDCTTDASEIKLLGTMAHEYQHLINYSRRVYAKSKDEAKKEVLWLDEGIAHLAEDLTGFGSGNYSVIRSYLEPANFNRVSFSGSYDMFTAPDQHVAGRAAAYLFLRYIFESFGGATYSTTDAKDIRDGGGIAFLQKLYDSKYAGLSNLAQASGKKMSELMADFVEALYFDGLEGATNGFGSPTDDPFTSCLHGIKLRDYEFTDSDDDTYAFNGPAIMDGHDIVELLDEGIEEFLDGEGTINYFVFDLADADVDGAIAINASALASVDGKMAAWVDLLQ